MSDVLLTAVCDSGPVIHLDELGCLDLLYDFPTLVIPERVVEEVRRHRAFEPRMDRCSVQPDLPLNDALQALERVYGLHHGEMAALVVARSHEHAILLTDDAAARMAAAAMHVPAHGTLGVLLRAIRRGRRTHSEIVEILERLPHTSSLHIRQHLIDDAIRQVRSLV